MVLAVGSVQHVSEEGVIRAASELISAELHFTTFLYTYSGTIMGRTTPSGDWKICYTLRQPLLTLRT